MTDNHTQPTEEIVEDVIETASVESDKGKEKQADVLIRLAARAGFFHTPDGVGYADVDVNGHRETWPLRSKGFKRWLQMQFYVQKGGAPNSEAVQSALGVLDAKAQFNSPEMPIHVRLAGDADRIYIDCANPTWSAIEVSPAGWQEIPASPLRFRRAAGMQSQVTPARGGSIELLRPFLNVKSKDDFVLAAAWTLGALRHRGPYPVMVLAGEHGSAKSTFENVVRSLVDPSTTPVRALPREDRDLFIAATNGHVLAFDNVSGIPAWVSDTLCRLATGGGFAVRQLYSDGDEVLFDACRPIILNGIEDVVTRPDLADRSLFLTLEPIPESKRRAEAEFWAAFAMQKPLILGALLDALAAGLRRLPATRLDALPRMADFAIWATACEAALWRPGTFISAYRGNLADVVDNVLEADPVAVSVLKLMEARTTWSGTASDLLGALRELASEQVLKSKAWPADSKRLGGRLRRAAPFLRKVGLGVTFERVGRGRTKRITVAPLPDGVGKSTSASSAMSTRKEINGLGADDSADDSACADNRRDDGPHPNVRSNPLKSLNEDDADHADDKTHTQSGGGARKQWTA
jgi:hypothetical protein